MAKKKRASLFVAALAFVVLAFLNEKGEGLKIDEVFLCESEKFAFYYLQKKLECGKTNIINYYEYKSPYMFVKLDEGVDNPNGILYMLKLKAYFLLIFIATVTKIKSSLGIVGPGTTEGNIGFKTSTSQ